MAVIPPAITAAGLCKSYGEKVVLGDVSFQVPAGCIWALLGPNGAGKTTTVQILSTLIRPDAGTVTVAGRDLAADPDGVRRMIGVTGQFAAVDEMLTGEENLLLMGDLHHLPRPETRRRAGELLGQFDLAADAGKLASTYSGGMRRKLDLAMTLIGRPQVIFLDEPTAGLDPRSRHAMWAIIRDLAAAGVTIFLTTQYLEEADQLASRIAVLDHGTLIAQGSPAELKRLVPGGHIVLGFADLAAVAAATRCLDEVTRDDQALSVRVPSDGSPESVRTVLDRLDQARVAPATLSVHTPDLDDVFLTITGRAAAGDGPGTADGAAARTGEKAVAR
jgi:ABC-2 type transport system ATP-binding protein